MPDAYTNENNNLPSGPFTWVPPIPNDGKASFSGDGFNFLSIVRGRFRNDVPRDDENDNRGFVSVDVSYIGDLQSGLTEFSRNYPFLSAFRRKRRPSWDVASPPINQYFTISPNDSGEMEYKISLNENTFVSSISIEYQLIIDTKSESWMTMLQDENDYNSEDDQVKFQAYIDGGLINEPDIDWSLYHPLQIIGYTDDISDGIELPILKDDKYQAMSITARKGSTFENNTVYKTHLFDLGGLTYPNVKHIAIRLRNPQYKSLTLVIKKILLFNEARVNMREDHLPAIAFGYSSELSHSFLVTPGQQGGLYPTASSGRPLIYFKLFYPEDLKASVGFAHALDVRFLIVIIPALLIGGDYSNLAGVIDAANNPRAYLGINAGPRPGKRQIAYAADAHVLSGNGLSPIMGNIVPLDYDELLPNVVSFDIERGEGTATTPPSGWTFLANVNASNTNFDIAGPMIAPYLYLDSVDFDIVYWYRIVQRYRVGGSTATRLGNAFLPQIYTEANPLRMAESSGVTNVKQTNIIRRIKESIYNGDDSILDAPPLALFMAEDSNHLANRAEFSEGVFNAKLKAYIQGNILNSNTHLVVRFWFHPEGVPLDANNPHQFRADSEFVFKPSDDGRQILSRTTPTSVNQLMITPALNNEEVVYSLNKYIQGVEGENVANNVWTMPESFFVPENINQRARLVVGIYQTTVVDEADQELFFESQNSPKVNIDVHPDHTSFSTTIGQTVSGDLFAVQPNLFGSANYNNLDSPLFVSRNQYNGNNFGDDEWIEYDMKLNKTDNGNAFADLLTLTSTTAESNIVIPYTSIPLSLNSTINYYADYITNASSLGDGRIQTGTWDIKASVDMDIDNDQIETRYRIEAFLVDDSGYLLNYILRSELLEVPEYKANVVIPYNIEDSNAQLGLRIIAYPYSKSGEPVDLAALKQSLGNKPLGMRLKEIAIQTHTVQLLALNQTDSLRLSKASFEGLPVTPNRTFGGNRFWVDLEEDTNQQVVIANDPNLGQYRISARLFSPTWLIDLPQNMEIEYNATAYSGNVKVRTALGGSAGDDGVISSSYNKTKQELYVAHTVDGNALSNNYIASDDDNATQVIASSWPGAYGKYDIATGSYNQNGQSLQKILSGRNPNLIPSYDRGRLDMVLQQDTSQGSDIALYKNQHGADSQHWNNNVNGINDQTNIAQDMQYPVVMEGMYRNRIVAGWLNPGYLGFKAVDTDIVNSSVVDPQGYKFLAEGSGALGGDWKTTRNMLNIPVVQAPFGAVIVDDHLNFTYSLEGRDGSLYYKEFTGYNVSGSTYEIVSFRKITGVADSSLQIRGSNLIWHPVLGKFICVFWCGGRIFATSFVRGPSGVVLSPLLLVGGSDQFTSSGVDLIFATAKTISYINTNIQEPDIDLIASQKPGITLSDDLPNDKSSVFVHYKMPDGKIVSRRINIDGYTGKPIIMNPI